VYRVRFVVSARGCLCAGFGSWSHHEGVWCVGRQFLIGAIFYFVISPFTPLIGLIKDLIGVFSM
jgi:hypothetical protein